jgi:two-component system, OmpR family, sensor histidine kinase TctE
MRLPESTLRSKLLAWLLGPLVVLLVLDVAVTYSTSVSYSNQAYDRALHEIAREVCLHVRYDDERPRLDMPPGTERLLMVDQDDRIFYKVVAEDGSLVGGDASVPAPLKLYADRPAFYNDMLGDERVRIVAAHMECDDKGAKDTKRTVLVQVAETLNKRNRLAGDIRASVFIPQLLLIALAAIVVHYGVARSLRPLQLLKRAVSDRSHLDLSPIPTTGVPGEVRPLVEEVNELMLRLGTTLNFQNRFIADAAHQLKTPVAGIKAQIEVALREQNLGEMQRSLAQLYMSADRLSHLVGQLLSLARNEPGAVESLVLQRLDLNALALEVTMEWVPEALKRNVDLGFEGSEAVTIKGDPHRLRELINNLVDNAVRYSQDGGHVTVRVSGDEQPQLSISDDGPKIPVEERKRIFERFHRLLGTHTDGSGLGLAIVSEIATLHKAQITLEEDADGVGNTFSVAFPHPDTPSA